MSGGSEHPFEDDGLDITVEDLAAALGELHGLLHHLSARVQRAEQRAADAEARAELAVAAVLGELPDAPPDELTSDGDQGGGS
jgi:hypothetical protein